MARRQNPIDFTVTPGARESIDLRTRTAASMYSPIKHRAIEEKFATSPHNFRVVLLPAPPWTPTAASDAALAARPDAITLIHSGQPRATQSRGEPTSESIYTAFTYMHRLGDEVLPDILRGSYIPLRLGGSVFGQEQRTGGYLRMNTALAEEANRVRDELLALMSVTLDALVDVSADASRRTVPFGSLSYNEQQQRLESVAAVRVNSKMVREDYAANEGQAISDMFALAELTPPTRPLLRPYETPEEISKSTGSLTGGWGMARYGLVNEQAMAVLNAYFAQHNILWRKWHDFFVRANYGAVVDIR